MSHSTTANTPDHTTRRSVHELGLDELEDASGGQTLTTDTDDGGTRQKDHDKWCNVAVVNIGGHK